MKKPVIIYTYTHFSSFVAKDFEIINKHYEVKKVLFNSNKKYFIPFYLIKQLYFWVITINKPVLFLSRFSGFHTLLPALFNKLLPNTKSIIILGGSDSNLFPSIDYGNYRSFLYGFATQWSIKHAYHLLPVSKDLIETTNTYSEADPKLQGVKNLIKGFNVPFTEIHNGFNDHKFQNTKLATKQSNSFVTIAGGADSKKIRELKGIDLIIEAAKELKHYSFTIIGSAYNHPDLPSNITFLPFIKNSELPHFLSTQEFYLQISISEGFPNALCEAMLCECIPVISQVGILPEIIGNSGYILKKRDSKELISLIKTHGKYSENLANEARTRIQLNYPLKKREEKLLKTLKNIMS